MPQQGTGSVGRGPGGGAPGEFVLLFARHQREIYAYIAAALPNWSDADEVMQETSLALWDHFDRWRPGAGSFVAWACGVAHHRILRKRRAMGRDRLRFSEEFERAALAAVAEAEDLESRRRALEGCVGKLPAADRSLLEAVYAGDRTIREVAEALNRPAKAVYKLLARLRDALADCVTAALTCDPAGDPGDAPRPEEARP
jgi:RNA polymerase sigma-70 factor (ECF subfamily)